MSRYRIKPENYTILIVDDSTLNIQVLGSVLREHDFNFEYAINGKEALKKLDVLEIDLVLLDIMMPGVDGFEVCTIIRDDERFANLPVIFLTAKADKESIVKGFDVGGQDYIVKPFDVNELVARVSTHLELRSHRELLKDTNRLLEQKVEKRTHDLVEACKKAEESDRLKSVFLANMSHEIRTPMNGILGFTGILKEPDITSEERVEYLGVIEDCGKHLLSIINDLVDISRVEAGLVQVTKQAVDVKRRIEDSFKFFKVEADTKGLDLSYSLDDSLVDTVILTDAEKVYALLTNLIKNALKFTQDGGIEFGYIVKGDMLEFFVHDTGEGISTEQQALVFDRFIQAADKQKGLHEGNGLGLSIAKAYVHMLGGRIWLESTLGKGSSFYFTLPLDRPE